MPGEGARERMLDEMVRVDHAGEFGAVQIYRGQRAVFERIDVPVLCLRGADSDLLLADTAEAMRDRGPRALVVTIAGCGHAPALNVPAQFELVQRFLAGH